MLTYKEHAADHYQDSMIYSVVRTSYYGNKSSSMLPAPFTAPLFLSVVLELLVRDAPPSKQHSNATCCGTHHPNPSLGLCCRPLLPTRPQSSPCSTNHGREGREGRRPVGDGGRQNPKPPLQKCHTRVYPRCHCTSCVAILRSYIVYRISRWCYHS